MLQAPESVVVAPLGDHPAGHPWHPTTLEAWREFFESPMADQWLPTDITGLRMVAVLYDGFYQTGNVEYMKEIRLQRPCYGLTPLDRSRLQWEVARGDEAERKRTKQTVQKQSGGDPRKVLRMATPA